MGASSTGLGFMPVKPRDFRPCWIASMLEKSWHRTLRHFASLISWQCTFRGGALRRGESVRAYRPQKYSYRDHAVGPCAIAKRRRRPVDHHGVGKDMPVIARGAKCAGSILGQNTPRSASSSISAPHQVHLHFQRRRAFGQFLDQLVGHIDHGLRRRGVHFVPNLVERVGQANAHVGSARRTRNSPRPCLRQQPNRNNCGCPWRHSMSAWARIWSAADACLRHDSLR